MLTPAHIELYCRMQADPYYRAGYRVDHALIFCERVEQRLAELDEFDRCAVILQGCGYTQREAADRMWVSLKTMSRTMIAVNDALFAELNVLVGKRVGALQGGLPRMRAA